MTALDDSVTPTPTPAAPAEIEDVLALSPLQEGLFTLARTVDTDVDPYTIQFVADIDGPLDTTVLRSSVDAVLRRHPNLRVSFWDRDLPHPVQIVPAAVDVPWREIDASPDDLIGLADDERRRRFDLADGPVVRFLLVRVGDDSRRLIGTAHHIVMDGWSVPIFVQELIGAYLAGGSVEAFPAPRLYRDYIAWLAAQDKEAARAAWAAHLRSVDAPTMLADGRSRGGTDTLPVKTELNLGTADSERLIRWTRTHGLTVNTATQFAWALLLGRLTGRTSVTFGATTAGRPDDISGVETMIGLFINTLPAHVRVDDSVSILDQCVALQRDTGLLRTHGYLGLSEIQRIAGVGDLFDSLMVFQNAPRGSVADAVTAPDGVRFTPVEMDSLTHYPLTLVPYLDRGTLGLVVEHRPDLLPNLGAAEIGERLLHVLRQLPALENRTSREIEILLPGERDRILSVATTPAVSEQDSPPASTVHGLVEYYAATTPDAVALTSSTVSLTFAQFNAAANRIAHRLLDLGVGPEDAVAVALPRSIDFVVALIGVSKAGATSVPVGIDLPAARLAAILRRTGTRIAVVTAGSEPEGLGDAVLLDVAGSEGRDTDPDLDIHPDRSVYIVFTSGSTGEPKGVVATHRGIATLLADHRRRVYRPAATRLGRRLVVGHAWSLTFDASWQPTMALLDGHTVAMFGYDTTRDPVRLVRGIVDRGVDMIETSPSMFGRLADAGLLVDDGTRCILSVLGLGGEAVGASAWAALRALPGTDVYNFYGPTETTVDALVAGFDETGSPAVGRPVAGMSGYVLDSHLRLVPDGVAGELYLSGNQVTRGYLGRPDITAARFLAHPFGGSGRAYRTGDIVRRRPDGNLVYLGRSDDQVKIRGYRIELAEIEAALQTVPGVTAATVFVVQRPTGPGLSAFVVTDSDDAASLPLRSRLADVLPAYMIPSRFTAVRSLPTTSNGKLDAAALLEQEERLHDGSGDAPRNDTEVALLALLSGLVGTESITVTSDFFDLGVDSIAAISFVDRARARGISITPRLVATNPSVRDLAIAIEAHRASAAVEIADEPGDVVALPIVRWLFDYDGFRRFTQTQLIRVPRDTTPGDVVSALQRVVDAHEMLRSTLVRSEGGWRIVTRHPGVVDAADLTTTVDAGNGLDAAVQHHSRAAIDRIDPERGSMLQAVLFVGEDEITLLLTIHHLAVDAVSWNVLFGDLNGASAHGSVEPEVTSYRTWSQAMADRAATPEVRDQRSYWAAQCRGDDPAIGTRRIDPSIDTAASLAVTTTRTSAAHTASVLRRANARTGVRELLLTALASTIAQWRIGRGQDPRAGTLVALEGHGRSDHLADDPRTDTTRTVGWFTTVFPLRIGAGDQYPTAESVADQVAEIPNGGNDFGILSRASGDADLVVNPQIEFNYLGRFDIGGTGADGSSSWQMVLDEKLHEQLPVAPEPDLPLRYELEVIVAVGPSAEGPEIVTSWRWSRNVLTEHDVAVLASFWNEATAELANGTGL